MRRRSRLPAIPLLLLAGCRLAAPDVATLVPRGPAQLADTREFQLANDSITVRLHVPFTSEPRKPAVISLLGERASLLREGFLVVTYRVNGPEKTPPAPPPPATTVGKWILASPSAAVLGREYLRGVATTANQVIPRIVDFLQRVPEVDASRIAFVGASTNGFVALQAVARDRRLAAAVVLSACGDYHRFLRDSSLGMEGVPLALAPDYERWLRAQEVVRHPRRVVHAAVLMVNRDHDPIIPFTCAEETARVLRRAYEEAGASDRFRFTAIASDRHGLDRQDTREALAWLHRWLDAAPRTGPGTGPAAP